MKDVTKVVIKKKITVLDDDGTKKMNLNVQSMLDLIGESKANEISFVVAPREVGAEGKKNMSFERLENDFDITEKGEGEFTLVRKGVEVEEVIKTEEGEDVSIEDEETVKVDSEEDLPDWAKTNSKEKSVKPKKEEKAFVTLVRSVTVNTVEEALEILKTKIYEDITTRSREYVNKVTNVFKRGTAQGQVYSLFKDVYIYGAEAVKGKLLEFVEYSKEEPEYKEYARDYAEEVDPVTVTASKNLIDSTYFKYYILRKVAESV
jgi:hypothetical protein